MKGLILYVLLIVLGAISGVVGLWHAFFKRGKALGRHDDDES